MYPKNKFKHNFKIIKTNNEMNLNVMSCMTIMTFYVKRTCMETSIEWVGERKH